MPGNHLFEYAVIRIVPRVEREEFINAGVILYCASHRFLGVSYHLAESRISALYPDLDLDTLKGNFGSFKRIAEGGTAAGPIGSLDMPSRFRWLTAVRSTVVQTSRVHPGLCTDPAEALEHLFMQLVL